MQNPLQAGWRQVLLADRMEGTAGLAPGSASANTVRFGTALLNSSDGDDKLSTPRCIC